MKRDSSNTSPRVTGSNPILLKIIAHFALMRRLMIVGKTNVHLAVDNRMYTAVYL